LEAERLHHENLEVSKRVNGPNHYDTFAIMSSLAVAHLHLGPFAG
jgi:hypothetical protein